MTLIKEKEKELMATANEVALLDSVLKLHEHFENMGKTVVAAARVVEALIQRVEKLEEKLNQ